MLQISRVLAASLLLSALIGGCVVSSQPADYSFASGLAPIAVPAR